MSNHSGIGVSSELAKELSEFRKGNDRALILKIANEKCDLDVRIAGSGHSLRADLEQIVSRIDPNTVRYVLIRLENDRFAFGTVVPDESSGRDKMIYASSSPLIRKQLPNHSSHFWADANEIVADVVLDDDNDNDVNSRGNVGTVGNSDATGVDEASRTACEVTAHKVATAERTQRAETQSGAAVSLGLPTDATAALKTLHKGGLVALVVGGEQLHMHTHAADLNASQVCDRFGPEPTYGVYHEPKSDKVWFIYRCPDQVKAKDRMIAASCRNGVLNNIKQVCRVDATIDTSDEIELDEQAIEVENANLNPVEHQYVGTEVRKMRRPAKPGRVPRR